MIYFTRDKKKPEERNKTQRVSIVRITNKSSKNIKILRVILKQGFRYIEDIVSVRDNKIKTELAIKLFQNLGQKTSYQIYQTTVASATHYASTIWSSGAILKTF